MTSRRRPALAKQRGNGDIQRVGEGGGSVSGDVNLAVLDPVDLEVGNPQLLGESLTAPSLAFANLLDPSSYKRKFISHLRRISDSDTAAQEVSGATTEVRDSVGSVRRPLESLTPEECEQWMLDVGYKLDNGRLDHSRAMKDAGVKSKWAVIKMRWRDGDAPEDREKITAALLERDRKRSEPTLLARKLIALEQWDALALDLLEDVDVFERQIQEARRSAEVAKAKARAREVAREAAEMEAALPFGSPVPLADPMKRTRK